MIDGLINQHTIDAITDFQKSVVKMTNPDSRINASGNTLKTLVKTSGFKPSTTLTTALGLIRSDKFITLYNKQYFPLAPAHQKGLTDLLGYVSTDKDITDIRWAAYMLATTMHETDRKWLPVEEIRKGGTRKYAQEIEVTDKVGKKYKNSYYGRGYVQLTWEENYKKLGKAIGMGDDLRLYPEKALEPDVAYKIMSYGMRNGSFSGKKLADYIAGTSADYFHARRIINLLDKAQLIQGFAETLEQLLRLSQNQPKQSKYVVQSTPTANVCFA